MTRILRWLWRAAVTLALFLVLLAGVVAIVIPKLAGASTLTVLTGSMRPGLPPGTLLVVRPTAPAAIRIGDVITYEPNALDATTLISHRVTAITAGSDGSFVFTVQGDANSAPDAPVRQKQVVGKLWYAVPGLGWVNSLMTDEHRTMMSRVAALALFGYALAMAATGYRRVRSRRASAEDGDAWPNTTSIDSSVRGPDLTTSPR